jgi:hypothetical protein
MNALKHGCDAAPENEAAVMRALGEDPERYAALKRELATAYGPGDALWDRQIEDLARLYWRRQRMERMETGLMRRALEAVEERERARRSQIAAVTFEPSKLDATDLELGEPTDPCGHLRLEISLLRVIREQLPRGIFTLGQQKVIQKHQQGALGWRPARLRHLMWMFRQRAYFQVQKNEAGLRDFVNENMGGEANVDPLWRELLRLLEEEIAVVEKQFAAEVKAREEKDAIERDACLAPAGETWEMLARQQMALDRSIDRKVRILLTMRKEHAQQCRGGSRTAPTQREASPPDNETDDREAQELSKLVGLDSGEVAPNFSSADAGLKASASAPESALGRRGESPLQVNVTCNRLQLRRGDTGWGAAGGERPVRTIRNSIRPVRWGEPASEWRSPEFPLGEEPVVGWNLGAIRRWVTCPDETQRPQVVGDGMVGRPGA